MSNWCIFCTGSSIQSKIEELKEHFKDWENSIAVNRAVEEFPSSYWCFLDYHVFDQYPQEREKRLVVTSRLCASTIYRHNKQFKPFDIIEITPSNSGIFAIQYAISKGAKNIVTCGFDLSDNWQYYNSYNPRPKDSYPKLMRSSFRKLNKHGASIYSVDPNNTLGLKFYDITKGLNL